MEEIRVFMRTIHISVRPELHVKELANDYLTATIAHALQIY